MAESQNIEWKESWRDEYLKWICGYHDKIISNLKIIEYLEKKPMATQQELQEMLNETRTHIQGAMKELVNEGVIERKGGKRFGFWEIKR